MGRARPGRDSAGRPAEPLRPETLARLEPRPPLPELPRKSASGAGSRAGIALPRTTYSLGSRNHPFCRTSTVPDAGSASPVIRWRAHPQALGNSSAVSRLG